MIAVVYSGSRFADWRLANKGRIVTGFRTMGINPNLHDERFILQLLNKTNNLINHAEDIKRIYFFGAGVSSAEWQQKITQVFESFFKFAKVTVDQDVVASALATLGDNKGLIGILGSGSNAAYYSGKKIPENNYGLGYMLGDEGSSNWIGRMLLKSFLTETMPKDLSEAFYARYPLDRKQILDKVYNNPYPNIFLTSFADFVFENRSHPFIKKMVIDGFNLYFYTYVLPLVEQHPDLPIHFTGSVAASYEQWLSEVAALHQVQIGMVVREPIHNLLHYYINKH
jgi:glucosamine kinase